MLNCSNVASWGPISSSWFYSTDYYPTVWHDGGCWFWRVWPAQFSFSVYISIYIAAEFRKVPAGSLRNRRRMHVEFAQNLMAPLEVMVLPG